MKTIGRNRKAFIDQLFTSGHNFQCHCLENHFIAEPVDGANVRKVYDRFSSAKLRDNGNGNYTVRIHSNEWYEFKA